MRYRPRPILTRAESREIAERMRQVKQEAMTPVDIGKLMRKTINDALDRNGAVEQADLLRANIPAAAIDTRFRAILAECLDERRNGGIMT
jgi:hypothetical protein